MVDIIKSLGVPYVCGNPGSSFRGLQESIVNYGNNTQPEFLTCLHEESAVAMAHGYAKIEGKPLVVLAHGTVGLQHASMAIYNAYVDRVPVYLVLGNTLDATMRQQGYEWWHSVQDASAMVRDYVKWDDTPASLPHFGESAVRAYKIAMTPPYGPVVIVADTELQERPIPEGENLRVPKLTLASPPQGDSGAVAELARLLVGAANPVLIADKLARTPAGMQHLVELAELLQAAVISQNGRMGAWAGSVRAGQLVETMGAPRLLVGGALSLVVCAVLVWKLDRMNRRSAVSPGRADEKLSAGPSGFRMLTWEVDGPEYYRSSTVQLQGAESPRSFQVLVKDLPQGEFEVRATVTRADKSELKSRCHLTVMPGLER